MAISSGWVGSSAVNETGQRWMSAAGNAVRIGAPFWMSQMIGQSVYNITIPIYERYYNGIRYRGCWNTGWNFPFSKPGATEAPGGSFNGLAYGTCVSVQNQPEYSVLTIYTGTAANFRLTTDDGAVFNFFDTGRYDANYRNYKIDPNQATAWFDYLNARIGQTRFGLIVQV
ncbi:MAG: hypothetical protein RSB25_20630 [Acinetobacter sp.]